MVRVAALYDIHGNLPALRAVLADAEREGVDAFVIGGDVAAGPMPRETVERLMRLGEQARYVMGNADREVLEARDRSPSTSDEADPGERITRFAAESISPRQRDFLAAFRPSVTLELEGLGRVLFCHGSPASDTEILTRITPERRLRAVLGGVEAALVIVGHVHQQYDRSFDVRRVVNAGSVGLPYEGATGAYWALLGPDVKLRRSEYDIDHALREMRAACPDTDEWLSESLIEPADPDDVTELFESQARST